MKKGLLIMNRFLCTEKFVEHYEWLSAAAKNLGMVLELWDNASWPIWYGEQACSSLTEQIRPYQFILYWDKDVRFGRYLMGVCDKLHIPIYNTVESMAVCDDKSETYRILQKWNDQDIHKQEQIPLLPTIVAPMTYGNIGYTNLDFLQEVIHKLQFPMVVKECFGSFGQQVHLISDEVSLREWTMKLAGTPFLYQKYLRNSHGHDVRLQVVGDQVVAGMHRFSVSGDFRANLTNGGQMESYEPSMAEKELALRTVHALGLDFAGVDLLFSGGPDGEADVVCEVNSNAHFRNIAECTGVNVAEKIMEYIAGRCDNMGFAKTEHRKEEKINGVIYDMSPTPSFRHGIVNSNIHSMIKNGLKNSLCFVFMENLDYQYHSDENDDYVCPDIMVVCDRKYLKGSFYNGVPKFIAETLSPSTAKRDKTEKKDIYERAGVEEYWIVSPQGSVEIYYLVDGKFVLEQNYMLQNDQEEEDYNAEMEICLRAFPHIKMTLGEIFEGIE